MQPTGPRMPKRDTTISSYSQESGKKPEPIRPRDGVLTTFVRTNLVDTGASFGAGTMIGAGLPPSIKFLGPTIAGALFATVKQRPPGTKLAPAPTRRDSVIGDFGGLSPFLVGFPGQTYLAGKMGADARTRLMLRLAATGWSSFTGSLVAEKITRGKGYVRVHNDDKSAVYRIDPSTVAKGAGIFLAAGLGAKFGTPVLLNAVKRRTGLPRTRLGGEVWGDAINTGYLVAGAVAVKDTIFAASRKPESPTPEESSGSKPGSSPGGDMPSTI